MNKGIMITACTLLLLGGLFFIFLIKDIPATEQDVSIEQDELPEPEREEVPNPDKNSPSISEKISQTVTDVVEKAIEFLSKEEMNIVAIGDSLTEGIGDETKSGGFVGILERRIDSANDIPITVSNYGKKGNRTDQLLIRLEEEEINHSIKEADLVLITIGANDIMKIVKENFLSLSYDDFSSELDHYQNRLEAIMNYIRRMNPSAHIYLVGLFNPFAQYFGDIPELDIIVNDWNTRGRRVIEADHNATFIPIKDVFQNTEDHLFSADNFHPNALGYEKIADRVMEYITSTYRRVSN
ncbi:lysophospholipase L1-like esterase [Salirhabdus euzebyi]|uniref:Lysophospholipase L1-like esterase n=1 Tax=Salirhabdus euzebyi TaxID=394506 RepID=A0A841Q670_9BACI|nr:SGNH/GDSL hydrolase family protein [Salirhabdus euzebyi]MBB6453812.1 lysophospholipase L1-like esterase [Salirhabdus euzebyi]